MTSGEGDSRSTIGRQRRRELTVTASVLSYNSHATLPRVIEGIESQSRPPDRVIIVDNGSDEETLRYLRQLPSRYEVIFLPENIGLGAGHNTGWRRALEDPRCEYLWTLENDSIPPADCLEGLITAARDVASNDPRFGAIRPIQIHPDKPKSPKDEPPQVVSKMTFNGCLIPRSSIEKVGMLREDFFIDQDDWEFANRLMSADLTIYANPRTTIFHLGKGKGTNTVLRLYYRVRNGTYLRKHVKHSRWATVESLSRCAWSIVRTLATDDEKWRRIQARVTATRDGLRGDLGKKEYAFLSD